MSFSNMRYVVCSHKNRLIEAILMSTDKLPYKKENTRNYPKYNNVCSYVFFLRTQYRVRNSRGKNEPSVFEPLKFYCSRWPSVAPSLASVHLSGCEDPILC